MALGPKPRDYRQRTPKKLVRLALCSALSDRAAEGRVMVVERWPFPQPRTKDALAALAALRLDGRLMIVSGPEDVIAERCFANLTDVQLMRVGELNAYDVLCHDWVVFTDASLPGATAHAAEPSAPVEVGA